MDWRLLIAAAWIDNLLELQQPHHGVVSSV
jgi:hypothetical protein